MIVSPFSTPSLHTPLLSSPRLHKRCSGSVLYVLAYRACYWITSICGSPRTLFCSQTSSPHLSPRHNTNTHHHTTQSSVRHAIMPSTPPTSGAFRYCPSSFPPFPIQISIIFSPVSFRENQKRKNCPASSVNYVRLVILRAMMTRAMV